MNQTLILTNTQVGYRDMAQALSDKAKDKSTSRSIAYKAREASKALEALFSAELMERVTAAAPANGVEAAQPGA